MNKLWNYGDYANLLSHPNRIVRRWAFAAIENHYPNRYTDQVCNLIGDEDGRNDPCPCGSGKKYKKCCLKKNS